MARAWIGRAARSLSALRRLRPLAEQERAFLQAEFGASLNLDRLRLAGGGQPLGRIAWQPTSALIQLADSCFEQADPERPLRQAAYPILAHEALHVWQRVHRQCTVNVSVDGLWLGVMLGRRAYDYDRGLRDPELVLREFLAGNIERQGQMFEDFVRADVRDPSRRDPKFEYVAGHVRKFLERRS